MQRYEKKHNVIQSEAKNLGAIHVDVTEILRFVLNDKSETLENISQGNLPILGLDTTFSYSVNNFITIMITI